MRSLILGLTGLAAVFGSHNAEAQFPLPFYEPFPASYTNAPVDETVAVPAGGSNFPAKRLGNGGSASVWTIGNSAGGGSAVIVGGPAALTYPNLATNPVPTTGLYIRTNNTSATRSRGFVFTTQSSGTLYASFLVQALEIPASGENRLFAKLDNATTGNGSTSMAGVWLTSNNTLAISKSSNAGIGIESETPLSPGTHLVVLRYTWDPEAEDEVALWVDPTALNIPENEIPSPTLATTSGFDVESLSSFYIYHIGTEVVASLFLDEIRVGTSWADVTPTGTVCTGVGILTDAVSADVSEGVSASFRIVPTGTLPTIQWQISTNSGSNWDNIAGATNELYTTPILTLQNNGAQYRAIASVACNSSSITSSVANLTVQAAVPTAVGVVVDDRFADFVHQDPPVAISNSVWYGTSGLDSGSGAGMTATPPTGSALWLGYFTEDLAQPVHLDVGRALKATWVFTPNNVVANGGNSMRFGVFDYADGGTRVTADGFGGSAGNGTGVRGYMVTVNFGTAFNTDTPVSLYVRNNLGASDLMGTTANYVSLGSGPANGEFNGDPAFENGVEYTIELSVTRKAVNAVDFTVRIVGGALDFSHTVTDTNFAYTRFDAFGIRPNNQATTADSFLVTQFKVEVEEAAVVLAPFRITSIQVLAPGNVKLTWESVAGRNYSILSTESLTSPTWTTNATVPGLAGSTSYTNSPATSGERFYRIATP
ncbi:MAG TPA: hypothetical protein VEH04_06100 [Verrucomicrobiae bacterium]|nr:hypothetical protein [Verrucomicrobiae bacterium]